MLSEEDIRRYLRPPTANACTSDCDQITALEIDHACQLGFCDMLERIADDLPEIIDRPAARASVSVLRAGMPGHARLEEEILFPLLRRRADAAPELPAFLAQLEQEHANDHEFAHEIADELDALIEAGRARNGDMLGYMLRGYFTSQRRHIEWENATIVPLARRVLTVADLSELDALVAIHKAALPARQIIRGLLRAAGDEPCSGTCANCCDGGARPTGNGSGYA
ncbi:MAG: hemerythrin domain-containing protein [Hyphomicrobiaceae bacterium]